MRGIGIALLATGRAYSDYCIHDDDLSLMID